MTGTRTPSVSGPIVPDMFRGSRRLAPFLPLLQILPTSMSTALLAAAAIGDGVLHADRLRHTLVWAGAQRATAASKWRLTLAVLANHGRFVAEEAMLGVSDPTASGRRVAIEGREHLDAVNGGALLLGFHLGPPRTGFWLRSLGYPVRFAGRLEAARDDSRWNDALDAGEAIRLPPGTPEGRAEGLQRIRQLLRSGALVYLAADGPFGREAFRIALPGRDLVVRAGWFSLRRLTNVPVLPVFTYHHHRRRVIVVHPPLPAPNPDIARDKEICQGRLAPLAEDYVRRFPTQCRYLAFPPWSSANVSVVPRSADVLQVEASRATD